MKFKIEYFEGTYYSYFYNCGWEQLGIHYSEEFAIMRIKYFCKINNIKKWEIIRRTKKHDNI